MTAYSIANGSTTTFTDTTPGGGLVIDFDTLDNSFNIQINGVDLFVGGPAGAPNEVEFQTSGTSGQTVRFANGDLYETNSPAIWQLGNTNGDPVVRLVINPDGTIALSGVRANNAALEPLELFNGLTVNTAAIDAAWDDNGPNTITIGQVLTGPTNASGDFDDVPCFVSGTLIATKNGPVPVENLQIDDLILTYDHGYQPIRWIGSRDVNRATLRQNPKLIPILIRADALGAGFPKQDLVVSPQHRVLVSSTIAMRMFDCKEVLIPAKKLLSLNGVETLNSETDMVQYFHILFDDHEIIWSNGSPTESLFTGPAALKAISPQGREEIEALFPEICDPDFEPKSARFIPEKGRRMKKLVERHLTNNKPLFSETTRAA